MSVTRSLFALPIAGALVIALAGCGGSADTAEEPQPEASSAQAAAPEPDLEGMPDVVAVVNDEDITLDEFESVYSGELQRAAAEQQSGGEAVDQEALKAEVADMLVNNELLIQAAADAGVKAGDDDVEAMLEQVAQQGGLSTVDELMAAFDEQGMSEEEVRANAADQVLIEGYVEAKIPVEEPSDKELRAQYDQMVEQSKAQGSEEEIPAFDEVKDQLAQQAFAQAQNTQVQKKVESLRKSGDVEVTL